jgi:hypothetical protein
LHGQASFQAVKYRQEAVGKALEGKFASFRDFVVRAAAGVLHIGLATHELVLQFSSFGLQSGDFGVRSGQWV